MTSTNRFLKRAIAAALLPVTLCCTPAHAAPAQEGADVPADLVRERFAELIPELLERHDVPGVGLAIVRDGEVAWAQGYGLADVASGRPVTADTLFNAGSISKLLTAWGVMRLVDKQALELDEPVASYLTRWQLPESEYASAGVTVRRLMSHTAGLTMHSIPGFQEPQPLPVLEAILEGDYHHSMYTSGGTPLEFFAAPGHEWRYSGGGTVLLQLLIEERSLEQFDAYMQRRVLDPLGMTGSHFGWNDAVAERAATPYRNDGLIYPTYRFTGTSGAGLYTSAADLAKFAAAGMRAADAAPGRGILEPATVASMLEPVLLNDGNRGQCGLAYFLSPSDARPRQASHGGSNNGWEAQLTTLPDRGRAIVILTNSNNSRNFLGELVCTWAELEGEDTLSGCE